MRAGYPRNPNRGSQKSGATSRPPTCGLTSSASAVQSSSTDILKIQSGRPTDGLTSNISAPPLAKCPSRSNRFIPPLVTLAHLSGEKRSSLRNSWTSFKIPRVQASGISPPNTLKKESKINPCHRRQPMLVHILMPTPTTVTTSQNWTMVLPLLPMHCPTDFPAKPQLLGNLVLQQCNLWLGNSKEGKSSGLHHDFHDNLYILLSGYKRFLLFPPSAHRYLHPRGLIDRVQPNGLIVYAPPGELPSYVPVCGRRSQLPIRPDGLVPSDAARWRRKARLRVKREIDEHVLLLTLAKAPVSRVSARAKQSKPELRSSPKRRSSRLRPSFASVEWMKKASILKQTLPTTMTTTRGQ